MSCEYVEYLFDPFRGDIADGTISKQPTELAVRAGTWKVTCIADHVRVFAHDSSDEQIAGGAWQDGTIADRSGAIDGDEWNLIESTLRHAVAWTPPPVAPPSTTVPAAAQPAAKPSVKMANPGPLVVLTAVTSMAGMFAIIWGYEITDRTETWFEHAIELALLLIALGLTVYGFFGFTRACPRCRAWFERELTERESKGKGFGQTTFTYTSGGSARHGSSSFDEYLDHFRCRRCSNTWTANVYKNVRS